MEASFEAVDAVVDAVEDLRDLRVLGTASTTYHQSIKVCHIDGDSSFFSTGRPMSPNFGYMVILEPVFRL